MTVQDPPNGWVNVGDINSTVEWIDFDDATSTASPPAWRPSTTAGTSVTWPMTVSAGSWTVTPDEETIKRMVKKALKEELESLVGNFDETLALAEAFKKRMTDRGWSEGAAEAAGAELLVHLIRHGFNQAAADAEAEKSE